MSLLIITGIRLIIRSASGIWFLRKWLWAWVSAFGAVECKVASLSTGKTAWLSNSCPLARNFFALVLISSSQTSYTSIKMSIKGLTLIQKEFFQFNFNFFALVLISSSQTSYTSIKMSIKGLTLIQKEFFQFLDVAFRVIWTRECSNWRLTIAVLVSKPHCWLDGLFL